MENTPINTLDPCFLDQYSQVLSLILNNSVKEVTFVQRFCSETRRLFMETEGSQHEALWSKSGLRDSLSSPSLSMLRFLIPVIHSDILKNEITPAVLSYKDESPEMPELISELIDHVDIPSSYIEARFISSHPVKIKHGALCLLRDPVSDLEGSPETLLILRYILNKKPPPSLDKLRSIGSKMKPNSPSKPCNVLRILFQGGEKVEELPSNMCIDSYFDCLKYFSRYSNDTRHDMKRALLHGFHQLLNSSNKRIVLRVVDGLVRFGDAIDHPFVLKSLRDLLSSYLKGANGPLRDPEASDLDSKLLSCTLEACREFYTQYRSEEARALIEDLLLESNLELHHRVGCLQLLILLWSKESPPISTSLWFLCTTSRHWEVLETFLDLVSKLIFLNKTEGIPPLKGFLSLQLGNERSFVRAASLSVLRTLASTGGVLEYIDSPDLQDFFNDIFKNEAEAIVRRVAARLLTDLECSEDLKRVSIDVLRNDLDWEVKDIIMGFWEERLSTDSMAREAFDVAKGDHERRLRQRALKCLKGIGLGEEGDNCFDEYVEATFGLSGLMDDILQTKRELYKVYDADCF